MTWQRAENKAGHTVPWWKLMRRRVARAWGCKPWEVDEAPWDEVMLEIQISNIIGEA